MATLNPVQVITAVYGPEPRREGEFPAVYEVGVKALREVGPVTSIVERCQDLGDRGIQWLDVWCGDVRIASLNASHVAEVRYGNAK